MPGNMTPEQQARWDAIKAKVADEKAARRAAEAVVVEYDEMRPVMRTMLADLYNAGGVDDVAILDVAVLFELWTVDAAVAAGDIRRYGDGLYRCIQLHTTQSNWTPDTVPALWTRITVQDWAAWAPGTYATGAKVTHNGMRWISQIDSNHWEPGAAGVYENIWKEAV